jgi:hypothetical protein
MKKFIKLGRTLTEEQLAMINSNAAKRYNQIDKKALLHKFGTGYCGCGQVSTYQAIYQDDGCTIRETHCTTCIEQENHIKQPEINVFNFDQFFDAIPEYRETLRQRYEEKRSITNL